MKKYLGIIALLAMAACGGMIKNENGSEFLTQLDAEPIGCTYLYKLESEVSVYDVEDARRYLENKIADQARPGNAYWITSQRTRPNQWVIFGPERTFVLAANVYDCPHPRSVRTARSGGSDTVSGDYQITYPEPAYQTTYSVPVMQPVPIMPCGGTVYGSCY